jgi:membrane-associated phospholipid phosphatase
MQPEATPVAPPPNSHPLTASASPPSAGRSARAMAATLPWATRSARLVWIALEAVIVLDVVWLLAAGLRIESRSLAIELAAVAFLLAIAQAYGRTDRSARLSRLGESCAQLVTFGVALEVLSYLVTRTAAPLVDAWLVRADRAMSFDWLAWTATAHADPRVAWLLVSAYNALLPQLVVAAMVLALWRSATPLMLRLGASGLITVALSGFLPAVGMLPDAPHVPHFLALRADQLRTIDLTQLQGLISFPSYHAALAVLVGHALWEVPVVRYAALALNAVMLVATVSVGGHYLVDVLAGCAVAIGTIALVPSTSCARTPA